MTIEQRTKIFGFERRGKVLDPDPLNTFIFHSERTMNVYLARMLTILTENSIEVVDIMLQTGTEPPLPAWTQPYFGEPSSKFLSGKEINNENIQRNRFWGLKKERIIWKP